MQTDRVELTTKSPDWQHSPCLLANTSTVLVPLLWIYKQKFSNKPMKMEIIPFLLLSVMPWWQIHTNTQINTLECTFYDVFQARNCHFLMARADNQKGRDGWDEDIQERETHEAADMQKYGGWEKQRTDMWKTTSMWRTAPLVDRYKMEMGEGTSRDDRQERAKLSKYFTLRNSIFSMSATQ